MSAGIATKMSWASNRVTTFPDDMAYCLLGIFGISMDIRYGEGKNAFLRLEQELIKETMDESIFAWRYLGLPKCKHSETHGLLATWPCCFGDSANLTDQNSKKYKPRVSGTAYQWTKGGVEFHIPDVIGESGSGLTNNALNRRFRRSYKLALNCWNTRRYGDDTVVIALEKQNGQWRRVRCNEWIFTSSVRSSTSFNGSKASAIHIPQFVSGELR